MVSWQNFRWLPPLLAEAESQPQTMMEQLTPINQIRVIVGLVTVIVLGLVLFLVIKAGSHMVKGMSAAAKRLPESSLPDTDDWADKPLNQQIDEKK